jgi:hypothetical protein
LFGSNLVVTNSGFGFKQLVLGVSPEITSLVVLFCCRSCDTAVGMVSQLSALQPLNRGWIPGMDKRSFSSPGRLDQILANRPRVQSVAVVSFRAVKWRAHKSDPTSRFRKPTNVYPLPYIILLHSQKERVT